MDDDKERPKYLDPKEFYANELDSWETLWDWDLSLYENVLNILRHSVFLPDPDILYPLAATYILLPTKWIRIAGILFSFGDEGSGKSTIANFANAIHGFKYTFAPTDTFASIRNKLDSMRWIDTLTKTLEKEGALLAWDNIGIDTLKRDTKIYQLLLVGYDRSTDRLSIAGGDGANKEYHVFCPKILSSVEPIHLNAEFKELRRRLLVIPHKKWEKFTLEDKQHYEGMNFATDKIDLKGINWEGIQDEYYKFWNDEETCKQFVGWRGVLTRKGKKKFMIPDCINPSRWTIIVDLIATGLTLGTWENIADAINYFAKYWEYSDEKIYGEFSATLEHLRLFIEEETGNIKRLNEQCVVAGIAPQPLIINAKKLKDKLSVLQNTGALDITPNNKDINNYMWQLGFKLTTKGWVER